MLWLMALLIQDADTPAARLQNRIKDVSQRTMNAFVFVGGGSGVLIGEDGYFVTNHHVAGFVKGGTNVFLHNGKTYEAKLICTDSLGDLTLFKIEAPAGTKFDFLKLGDSDAVEVGDYCVAVGNPFNLGTISVNKTHYPSVSVGIISAVHRRQGTYSDCLQTDAAMNPGNSGGPLVNVDGEIIGINGRIATRFANRVNSGVGFAIPSNQVKRFLKVMMKGGEGGLAHHGEIKGLELSTEHLNGKGARVYKVGTGTSAEAAGFRPGDLIVKVEDYSVFSRDRFHGVVGTYPAGETLTVLVRRGNQDVEISAKLDKVGDPAVAQQSGRPAGAGYLGVRLDDGDGGIVLSDVVTNSPADEAGLKAGDGVLQINGRKVKTSDEFLKILWKCKPGEKVRLTVRREDREIEAEAVLTKYPGE